MNPQLHHWPYLGPSWCGRLGRNCFGRSPVKTRVNRASKFPLAGAEISAIIALAAGNSGQKIFGATVHLQRFDEQTD